MYAILAWAGIVFFATFPAAAQTAVPPEVRASLQQPELAGAARLRYWGFSVYDAQLWVEPGFQQREMARQSFALELRYLRELKGEDIARRSIEEMRRIGEFTPAQAGRWLAILTQAFPDVVTGDRITGVHRPDGGATFWVNGKLTVELREPVFAQLFFGIWLSDKSSQPDMRLALLGQR
jgi:hypothetical protein